MCVCVCICIYTQYINIFINIQIYINNKILTYNSSKKSANCTFSPIILHPYI